MMNVHLTSGAIATVISSGSFLNDSNLILHKAFDFDHPSKIPMDSIRVQTFSWLLVGIVLSPIWLALKNYLITLFDAIGILWLYKFSEHIIELKCVYKHFHKSA